MTAQADALELLSADHRGAMALCHALAALRARGASGAEMFDLVTRLCLLQRVHGRIEIEVFYPGVRAPIGKGVLLDQAQADDWVLKDLIADVLAMRSTDAGYGQGVETLCRAIAHHVTEQEEVIFPSARQAGIDLAALGVEIAQRRLELLAQGLSEGARLAAEDEAGDPVGRQ
jgi:hypothetical protein